MENKTASINYKILVENIRFLSKQKGMRINVLEDTLCVSSGYFSRMVNGKHKPKLDTIYKVSKLFGISINDLVEKSLYKEYRIKQIKKELKELEVL